MSSTDYVCPACRTALGRDAFDCPGCGARYEVRDGIPVFVRADTAQKAEQAAFFDQGVDEEFEIERPTGLPRLYAWLLEEKLRRAVRETPIDGRDILVVCGGSGMDAEFLARRGARVVSSDVAFGAAVRTRRRAERHGVPIRAVVADVERLPFGDGSFDAVYVHDGLHHLEDPLVGLAEMARVSRDVVFVTEPARARATEIAVRFGLALEVEDAGNRVARLTGEQIEKELRHHGYRDIRVQRYAMLYRHEPGRFMTFLSLPILLPLARAALGLLAAASGAFGNKLAVTASRRAGAGA